MKVIGTLALTLGASALLAPPGDARQLSIAGPFAPPSSLVIPASQHSAQAIQKIKQQRAKDKLARQKAAKRHAANADAAAGQAIKAQSELRKAKASNDANSAQSVATALKKLEASGGEYLVNQSQVRDLKDAHAKLERIEPRAKDVEAKIKINEARQAELNRRLADDRQSLETDFEALQQLARKVGDGVPGPRVEREMTRLRNNIERVGGKAELEAAESLIANERSAADTGYDPGNILAGLATAVPLQNGVTQDGVPGVAQGANQTCGPHCVVASEMNQPETSQDVQRRVSELRDTFRTQAMRQGISAEDANLIFDSGLSPDHMSALLSGRNILANRRNLAAGADGVQRLPESFGPGTGSLIVGLTRQMDLRNISNDASARFDLAFPQGRGPISSRLANQRVVQQHYIVLDSARPNETGTGMEFSGRDPQTGQQVDISDEALGEVFDGTAFEMPPV